MDYLSFDDRLELGLASLDDMLADQVTLPVDVAASTVMVAPERVMVQENVVPAVEQKKESPKVVDSSAPLCFSCGNQTQRSGSCYVCQVCGSTSGCS